MKIKLKDLICTVGVLGVFGLGAFLSDNVMADELDNGLVAHFAFDGDEKGKVSDGESMVTLNNVDSLNIKFADGVFGKAAVFNGKDSMIQTELSDALYMNDGTDKDISKKFSISFWAYNEDVEGEYSCYMQLGKEGKWKGDVYYSRPFSLRKEYGTASVFSLSADYTDDSVQPGFQTSGSGDIGNICLDGNEWFMYTITYDGVKIKVYRNDNLVGQQNYENGMTNHSDFGLTLGMNADSNDMFYKGMLDDMKMYNRTLSFEEVGALYNKGVSANPELVAPSKKLVAHYTFDNNLDDSSIYANTAEKVEANGTLSYTPGVVGMCTTLERGAYIRIPSKDYLNFHKEMTISYWLRRNADIEGSQPILSKLNPSMGTDVNASAYWSCVDKWTNNMSFSFGAGTYSTDSWSVSNEAGTSNIISGINNNSWFHCVNIIEADQQGSGGTAKLYVNGKLVQSQKIDKLYELSNSSGDMYIGYNGLESFFTGAIDELKIYNYALTADDVVKDYQLGNIMSESQEATPKPVETTNINNNVTANDINNVGSTIDTISVDEASIKSLKALKGKKIKVTLVKKVPGAAGYEIRYSTKNNMKNSKKYVIKKASTIKATISKLKKGKKYYVQVRAYAAINGSKFYSAWSPKKYIKVKK